MSLESKLLEFADKTFLIRLLDEYDSEKIEYHIPIPHGYGTNISENNNVKYDWDNVIMEINKNSSAIVISIYIVSTNYRTTTIDTTIGELKCEWKKFATENMKEMRESRTEELSLYRY